MIRSLRKRHLLMIGFLAALAPAVLLAAVVVRPAGPPAGRFPFLLQDGPPTPAHPAYRVQTTIAGVEVQATVSADSAPPAPPTQLAVTLALPHEFLLPDVLVYWRAGRPGTPADASAPAPVLVEAFLVGRLRGNRTVTLALPVAAGSEDGVLILYSLGHREIVGTIELPLGSEVYRGVRPNG